MSSYIPDVVTGISALVALLIELAPRRWSPPSSLSSSGPTARHARLPQVTQRLRWAAQLHAQGGLLTFCRRHPGAAVAMETSLRTHADKGSAGSRWCRVAAAGPVQHRPDGALRRPRRAAPHAGCCRGTSSTFVRVRCPRLAVACGAQRPGPAAASPEHHGGSCEPGDTLYVCLLRGDVFIDYECVFYKFVYLNMMCRLSLSEMLIEIGCVCLCL